MQGYEKTSSTRVPHKLRGQVGLNQTDSQPNWVGGWSVGQPPTHPVGLRVRLRLDIGSHKVPSENTYMSDQVLCRPKCLDYSLYFYQNTRWSLSMSLCVFLSQQYWQLKIFQYCLCGGEIHQLTKYPLRSGRVLRSKQLVFCVGSKH